LVGTHGRPGDQAALTQLVPLIYDEPMSFMISTSPLRAESLAERTASRWLGCGKRGAKLPRANSRGFTVAERMAKP